MAVDEWHELLGSKRGVQVELAPFEDHGVKAGVVFFHRDQRDDREPGAGEGGVAGGESEHRAQAQRGASRSDGKGFIVRALIHKPIEVESILPDEIEKYPWAGHLGLKLIHKVIPILEQSRTTLIFINTRGMSETWYQSLLTISPDLAGAIALHHGSIDMALRNWVEDALHEGKLKAVVCTASLDLGVDFRPVETVIQVGSPKGVARFLQRAGRSGHQPGEVSKI